MWHFQLTVCLWNMLHIDRWVPVHHQFQRNRQLVTFQLVSSMIYIDFLVAISYYVKTHATRLVSSWRTRNYIGVSPTDHSSPSRLWRRRRSRSRHRAEPLPTCRMRIFEKLQRQLWSAHQDKANDITGDDFRHVYRFSTLHCLHLTSFCVYLTKYQCCSCKIYMGGLASLRCTY